MEAVNDKKTRLAGRIVFLVSIVFLMATCQFAGAQGIIRESFNQDGKTVIKRYSNVSMNLKNPLLGKDISLNVFSDSISERIMTFAIYVYFPENINPRNQSIVINYSDGSFDVFQQVLFSQLEGESYAEYESILGLDNIFTKKVSSITLRGVAKYSDIDRTYFKDFLTAL